MDSNSIKRQLQQKRGRPTTADEDKVLDSLSSRDRLRLWQMVDFDPCIDITKVELPTLPAGANDTSVLDEELDPFEIARLKADKTPRQRPSNVNQPQPTFWRSSKPSTNQHSTPTSSTPSPTTRKHAATSPPSSLNRTTNNSNSLMTQDSVKNILQKKLGRPRTRAEDAYINKLNARDCARIAQIIQHSEDGLDITKIELVPIRDESEELPRSSSLRVNSQPSTPLLHRTSSDREDRSPINKKEPTDELDDLPMYSASSLQTKIDNEKALHSNHMTEMCDSRKARVPKFSGQNSNVKPSISTSRAQESDADARIAKLRQRFQEGTGKQVAQTARQYSTSLRQPFQNLNTPTAPSTSSPSHSMALVNTSTMQQSQQSFKSTPLTGEARLYQQKLQQKLGQFSIGPKKRIL